MLVSGSVCFAEFLCFGGWSHRSHTVDCLFFISSRFLTQFLSLIVYD